MSFSGVFISFEGVDGSGKTTQLERFAERLRQAGHEAVLAQEPGGTRVGREIRKLLLDAASSDLDPTAELLLYFASRTQNITQVICPALEQGRIVLVDRFTDATTAYQGYGRALGAGLVRELERIACAGVRPDLTLWLDIDPQVGVERSLRRQRGTATDETRFEREKLEFFERVVAGYRAIFEAEPERVKRIDASGSLDEVEERVLAAARPALAGAGVELL